MPGPIDHNMFVTVFWAVFFASLAVTAVKMVMRLVIRGVSAVFWWFASTMGFERENSWAIGRTITKTPVPSEPLSRSVSIWGRKARGFVKKSSKAADADLTSGAEVSR
jgi:hypothetical protein